MSGTETAAWVVWAAGFYGALGGAFALYLLAHGLRRLDPAAAQAGLGFKLLLLPGLIALWPYLALRLARGATPVERNAHDRAAREGPL